MIWKQTAPVSREMSQGFSAKTSYFKRRRTLALGILLSMVFCLLFTPVMADEQPLYSDPKKDNERIRITANALETDNEKNLAIFIGDVRAIQGDTVITCQRLNIYYGKKALSGGGGAGSVDRVIATETVKIIMENRIAVSDKAEYSMKTGEIVLTGEPAKVTTGNNSVAGKKITINRNNNRMNVERGASQRVEAVLYPEEDQNE